VIEALASRLANELADPERRPEAAAALARRLGAEALLVLIRDPELGALRPAPGFPQTLPGGPTWRRLLARCHVPGEYSGEVAFPNARTITTFRAFVDTDGAVVVLLGGNPALSRSDLGELGVPLLSALLRAESAQIAAAGLAAAARDATQRATALAGALDAARGEVEAKAVALERALAESARLNDELRRLNETLEQRVSERTRELEREVAERRKAEAALLQAQKMEAVGQLTGGVAHDFNNLLAVIMGTLDLIEQKARDDAPLQRLVGNAQRATERGERLTQQLLTFARRQQLRPKVVDIDELIRNFLGLLRHAVGEAVDIGTRCVAGPCRSHIDPVHFETAVLNLAVNARDAMPSGGALTIETGIVELDAGFVAEHPEVRPGSYVRVSVRDTGSGMAPETVDRVFEPFFTTKEVGKGTGLGLSQVYGFVKQSGGHIEIDSAPTIGTTITLYLPSVKGDVRSQTHSDEAVPLPNDLAGSEIVLVVEDDPDVLEMVLTSLDELGYRTIVARNGAEAMAVLESAMPIDLLFTDMVMPGGIGGATLAREARRLRADIKILLTSGYSARTAPPDDGLPGGLELIRKPYRQRELASKIRRMLGRTSPDEPEPTEPHSRRR
jgi:signal transduction histidine kinase/ActR/RegA family two-component response regulator